MEEVEVAYEIIRSLYWFGRRGTFLSDQSFVAIHGEEAYVRYILPIRRMEVGEIDPYALHFITGIVDEMIAQCLEDGLFLPPKWGFKKAKAYLSMQGGLREFCIILDEWRLGKDYVGWIKRQYDPCRRRADWPLSHVPLVTH